jgi:hypothetical protein
LARVSRVDGTCPQIPVRRRVWFRCRQGRRRVASERINRSAGTAPISPTPPLSAALQQWPLQKCQCGAADKRAKNGRAKTGSAGVGRDSARQAYAAAPPPAAGWAVVMWWPLLFARGCLSGCLGGRGAAGGLWSLGRQGWEVQCAGTCQGCISAHT